MHCVLVCIGHRGTARWPADAIGSALCRHRDALDRCTQLNRTPPNIRSTLARTGDRASMSR